MKRKLLQFALFFGMMLSGSLAYGQGFPWDDFKPRTLKEIVAMESDVESRRDKDKKNAVVLHADILPSRVRVTYTGSTRLISQTKKDFLLQWAQMYAANPEEYAKLYEVDMLVTEDGVEYWLPVQKRGLPHFEKELKKGEAVDLYLIRVGGIRTESKWDWLLLIEEFQKPK